MNENEKNSNTNKNEESNRSQKKQIIYLIIAALILLYVSLFFIHNIIDRGQIKDTESGTIIFPGKIDTDDINNQTNNNTNNNGNNNNGNNNGGNNGGKIVDNSDRIKVKQYGTQPFEELKELDMFRNFYFHDEAIIAPGVKGSYNFTVENDTINNYKYNITFTEENPYKVNMVYKMKLNGEYIVGSATEWKRHEDFTKYELPLNSPTVDLYEIEWKWEDTDYDTEIGETPGAYYKMHVDVQATRLD